MHYFVCSIDCIHETGAEQILLSKLSHSIIHGDYLLNDFLEWFTQMCSAGFINEALCMWQVEHIKWLEEQRRPAKMSIGKSSLFCAPTLVK